MPYWRLFYHAVWTCKNREPLIRSEFEDDLHQYMIRKGRSLSAKMHKVGGIEDHVHIVFSIAPKITVAGFIGKIKGASSHWVTHIIRNGEFFQWQDEYGIVSFGEENLPDVISYVDRQREHHMKNNIEPRFELCNNE